MADFTAREQLMLELINRARMDPSSEAKRYGIALNEGVADDDTISSRPKQVLAGNDKLGLAAENHSQWILTNDQLNHFESPGSPGFSGSSPFDRMTGAGYNWISAGENIAYIAGSSIKLTETISDMHRNFFVDANTTGRGHRVNILGEGYREVGIGHEAEIFNGQNASVVTTDFGTRAGTIFVTGVVYDDTKKNDNFFTVGEETSGRSVAGSGASDATGAGGGYELEYAAIGHKAVTFNLAGGSLAVDVTIAKTNVKIDVVNGHEIWTNAPSLTSLSTSIKELHALGISKVKLIGSDTGEKIFGNSAANKLTGNGGKDSITGSGGKDTITGGAGKDTLTGGAGDDKFVFKSHSDSTASKADIIKDFGNSGKDRIDLHLLGDLTYRDESKITGAHQVNVTRHGSDVIVHVNLDADKSDEMRIVLDHTSLSAMTKGDFIL